MFEKEAEKYISNLDECRTKDLMRDSFKDGAEFVYNKANEWHRVSDKLPEMDALVYLWKKGEDFPVVACRHIFCGQKEWVWDCMWGSGYTMSQSKGKDYLWKEIILPAEIVKEQKTSKGFYVYNPAGSKPSHIHETLEEAKAEAERIFKLNLNAGIQEPIEVLEIVAQCVPEIKIKWS